MDISSSQEGGKQVDLLFKSFYLGCILLIFVEIDMQVTNLLFEEHRHEYHDLEGLLGFYLWYAFGGIVLLVVIAKVLRRILMRPENYYDV
ncbi:MAG TPA: hypothetical protein EYQ69_01530 [Gemmatimonadetes bacterium]|nr:hypothetical protein [Gemmatimonadota bacterium]